MINKHHVVGIVGSRRRNHGNDYNLVVDAFWQLAENSKWDNENIIICSGRCPQGADKFAQQIAYDYPGNPIAYMDFPAMWEIYGKSAGYRRNCYIARTSDYLIACVAEDREGGTEHTIKQFLNKIQMSEGQAVRAGLLILV